MALQEAQQNHLSKLAGHIQLIQSLVSYVIIHCAYNNYVKIMISFNHQWCVQPEEELSLSAFEEVCYIIETDGLLVLHQCCIYRTHNHFQIDYI